jgi:MarR family transcriptional regulator, lower aerobic nicotinate degradation pathway regulator
VVESDSSSPEVSESLTELYRRPGFLIRRAHQIAVSLFLEETAEFGITTTQYGAMVVLRAMPQLDQINLSRLVGIDRSTTALVVSKLIEARYVICTTDPKDKRRNLLTLSKSGQKLLRSVTQPAQRARERLLSAFEPKEAKIFVDLLERFVETFNAGTRAPIVAPLVEKRKK